MDCQEAANRVNQAINIMIKDKRMIDKYAMMRPILWSQILKLHALSEQVVGIYFTMNFTSNSNTQPSQDFKTSNIDNCR